MMLIADAIVQRLMRRLDYTPVEASFRTQETASDRISIAPGCRLPIVLSLGLLDLLGVAVAIAWFGHGSVTNEEGVTIAALLLFGNQVCGHYACASTANLRHSAMGAAGLTAALLPVAAMAAWVVGGMPAVGPVALAITCIGVGVIVARLACSFVVRRFADVMAERVLIVGDCQSAEDLQRSCGPFSNRVRIVGHIVVGNSEPGSEPNDEAGDHTAEMITSFGDPQQRIDRVVILRANLDDNQLAFVIRSLAALSVPVHLRPGLPLADRSWGRSAEAEWIVRATPVTPGVRLAKRIFDLVASAVLLVLACPLLLLIALLIRLESPGPALFRQVRLGKDNRPFTVFKFRTMRDNAVGSDGSVQATRDDARITRIGAILRQTSLDELPQLLNVFGGSMSLVGPRPHPTPLNRRFVPLIENYSARHRVLPGITGWAQVNGYRGETPTVAEMQGRVDYDLEYVRDHSVGFDLWILLRTVVAVVTNRNAY